MIGDLVRDAGVVLEVVFDGRQLLLGPYSIQQPTGFSLRRFRKRKSRALRRKAARTRRFA